jgi:hypothetical protein
MTDHSEKARELREAMETRLVHLKANQEHWRVQNERLRRGETVTITTSNENYQGDEISFLEKVLVGLAEALAACRLEEAVDWRDAAVSLTRSAHEKWMEARIVELERVAGQPEAKSQGKPEVRAT